MLYTLLSEQMLVLFAILAIGSLIGHLSWRGLSLGSAAVFFVGLAFGHFGYTIPKTIMDLGLLLFLYAVGLQAGPRFFRTFRKQGWQFVVIAGASMLAAAGVTIALARVLNLPYALAAGMFTGAVTNTPALAGAIDTVARIEPLQTADGLGRLWHRLSVQHHRRDAARAVPAQAVTTGREDCRGAVASAAAPGTSGAAEEAILREQSEPGWEAAGRPRHPPAEPGQHLARTAGRPGRGGHPGSRLAHRRCAAGRGHRGGTEQTAAADRRRMQRADGDEHTGDQP